MAEIAQAGMTQAELEALGIVWPPTQDELPYDDGMPMESQRHVMQLQLLMDSAPSALGRTPGCVHWWEYVRVL